MSTGAVSGPSIRALMRHPLDSIIGMLALLVAIISRRSRLRLALFSRRTKPYRQSQDRRPCRRQRGVCPMAMTMNGEYQLAAPPQTVWEKLNDTETLKASIPGCETLDKVSDTEFQAVATVKIGPVKARFKGKVHLTDLNPPNSYKISGEGEGGVAGFAKGGATVALAPKDGGTLLTYNVEAQIGGKLAQLGQRLVNGAAKKVADEFFSNFAKAVSPPA
jgi:carbon monoxide dehydrogenase subunit G